MAGDGVRLMLRSTRVVTPDGIRAATIAVADGRIAALLPYDTRIPSSARLEDMGDDAVLPGLVDTHVHVNDPGRTAWEGFPAATRAAAAGGVTTLLDMPLNSLPPTTTVAGLRTKQRAARDRVHVDTGFWGGAIPGNLPNLRPLHDAGVFGFKCFLSPSGVEEFPELDADRLTRALTELTGFGEPGGSGSASAAAGPGALLIVHAEDPGRLTPQRPGPRYADFLASRPRDSENTAIALLIEHARRLNARIHVLHLSSGDALPLIASARVGGVRVTAETCPHFLTLTAEEIPDGATEFKCCPPIREAANRDALWAGLADGTIDCVVSDHSPCTADLKTADFDSAWGGISSLQLGLPIVWTEARRRGHTLADVARWMSTAPARLAGLHRKGAIEPGRDADFAVLAPGAGFTVDPARLHHRNPITAYAGRTLHGVVRSTWLRGTRVAVNGTVSAPIGRLLERDN